MGVLHAPARSSQVSVDGSGFSEMTERNGKSPGKTDGVSARIFGCSLDRSSLALRSMSKLDCGRRPGGPPPPLPRLAVLASIPARLVGVRPGVPRRCAGRAEGRESTPPPRLIVSSIELFIST